MPTLVRLPTATPCRIARPSQGDFRYASSTDDFRCALGRRLPTRPRRTISDALSTSDFRCAFHGRLPICPYGQLLRCTLDGRLRMPKLGLLAPGWRLSTILRHSVPPIISALPTYPWPTRPPSATPCTSLCQRYLLCSTAPVISAGFTAATNSAVAGVALLGSVGGSDAARR